MYTFMYLLIRQLNVKHHSSMQVLKSKERVVFLLNVFGKIKLY